MLTRKTTATTLVLLTIAGCRPPRHAAQPVVSSTTPAPAGFVEYWHPSLPRVEFPVIVSEHQRWADSSAETYETWFDPEKPPQSIKKFLAADQDSFKVTRLDSGLQTEMEKGSAGSLEEYWSGLGYRYQWRIEAIPSYYVSQAEFSRLNVAGNASTIDPQKWPRLQTANSRRAIIVRRMIAGVDDAPPPENGVKVISRIVEEIWDENLPRVRFEPTRSAPGEPHFARAFDQEEFKVPGVGDKVTMRRVSNLAWKRQFLGNQEEVKRFLENPLSSFWMVESIPATFKVTTTYSLPGKPGTQTKVDMIREDASQARRIVTFRESRKVPGGGPAKVYELKERKTGSGTVEWTVNDVENR